MSTTTIAEVAQDAAHARATALEPAEVEIILNAAAGARSPDEVGRTVAEAFAACGVEARVRLAREGGEVERLARLAL
jgi:hypothetical protein